MDDTITRLRQRQLERATADLARDPPPESDCAQTLGARRFAAQLEDLGRAYSDLGDDSRAAEAYRQAIACSPRAIFLHAELAAALLNLHRYAQARVELQRQLNSARASFPSHSLLVQLDFIQDRWPDAVSDARLAVTEAPDDEQATYWQCFLWLAQMHVGNHEPALGPHRITDNWPRPVLEFLQDKETESDVVDEVKSEHDARRQREILAEALFYAGELRLAANQVEEARRYFTATVDLGVAYFIEHHLAAAELDKLRRHGPLAARWRPDP